MSSRIEREINNNSIYRNHTRVDVPSAQETILNIGREFLDMQGFQARRMEVSVQDGDNSPGYAKGYSPRTGTIAAARKLDFDIFKR